ncbi:MAG TPA: sigma 54-interacting transcriptional regulator, partial [Actinomycetota bacterium]|nr:sigma 54-interacting transcriptional regulator [Actinomycetota bacterium]
PRVLGPMSTVEALDEVSARGSSDWSRYVRLRVVRNLTDVIRRWFRVEITFADETGYVRAFPGNRIFEPTNPVCRQVLADREGFRRCGGSSAEAHGLVRRIGRPGDRRPRPAESVCHAGFRQIVIPVEVGGRVVGSVIAGGILPDADPEEIVARVSALGIDAESVRQALPHVPRIDELSLQYLLELVALVVQEVVRFHGELAEKEAALARLSQELQGKYGFGAIIGQSRPIREMLATLEKVCASDSTILVQGENGTGKELIARAIHWNSPRRDKPFVTQSAAAFNDNLLESELFGHVKGAFTGAIKDKKGLLEAADGGTLFLDELGEMTAAMQVKLLRVLQEGTFMPVGSTETKRVDIRLVCATNRDLRRMVERGEFREDLYYRINVINVHVPPLRDRREDIPLLVRHFLKQLAVEKKTTPKEVSDEVLERFYDYEWPGNIRELENEIERLVVMTGDEPRVTAELLSQRIKDRSMRANVRGVRVEKTLDQILEEVERRVLMEGLRKHRWNKTQLARQLGISRKGLIAKVQRYQLDRRREPRA